MTIPSYEVTAELQLPAPTSHIKKARERTDGVPKSNVQKIKTTPSFITGDMAPLCFIHCHTAVVIPVFQISTLLVIFVSSSPTTIFQTRDFGIDRVKFLDLGFSCLLIVLEGH